jgi:NitT/TauT family transport system ATP-binding protein
MGVANELGKDGGSGRGAVSQARSFSSVGLRSADAQLAPALELSAVTKRFGALTAVERLSFSVSAGEFLAIVGPSGSGKSTLLGMIAGLDMPSEGSISLLGKRVSGPNVNVGYMLQKDLLLPWRTIRKNVEFGLEARPVKAAQRKARALEELKRCRLEGFADHYPRQLSGGMRQRAALARTLTIDPELILLDEPFSALDAQTKLILQKSFAGTISECGVTTVLITHDLEAVAMADRILVLSERPGRLLEDIVVDIPDRSDPLARRLHPRANDYVKHLFDLMKLDERMA